MSYVNKGHVTGANRGPSIVNASDKKREYKKGKEETVLWFVCVWAAVTWICPHLNLLSGRKKSKLKSLRSRLFGKSKRTGGEGDAKLSQSASDINAGKGLGSDEDLAWVL